MNVNGWYRVHHEAHCFDVARATRDRGNAPEKNKVDTLSLQKTNITERFHEINGISGHPVGELSA
jgi:hypothetical protein